VQVKIAVRHGHLSEEAQSIIREKAEKLLHYFERLTMIEVTVDLKKSEEDKCRVELVVQAEHKHDFVAQESHHDMMAAVELTLGKLEAQLRRYKEKIQDHRRRLGRGPGPGEELPGEPEEETVE
jgi:putative sigma-54 modulation protein